MSTQTLSPGTLADLTPGTWTVDPTHSTIGFTARHLMITKVHGHFADFDGTVVVADDPLASNLSATVRLTSVDSGNADRDAHLRNADFFDGSSSLEAHPEPIAIVARTKVTAVETRRFTFAIRGILGTP